MTAVVIAVPWLVAAVLAVVYMAWPETPEPWVDVASKHRLKT